MKASSSLIYVEIKMGLWIGMGNEIEIVGIGIVCAFVLLIHKTYSVLVVLDDDDITHTHLLLYQTD